MLMLPWSVNAMFNAFMVSNIVKQSYICMWDIKKESCPFLVISNICIKNNNLNHLCILKILHSAVSIRSVVYHVCVHVHGCQLGQFCSNCYLLVFFSLQMVLERYFYMSGQGIELVLPKNLDLQEKLRKGPPEDIDFLDEFES